MVLKQSLGLFFVGHFSGWTAILTLTDKTSMDSNRLSFSLAKTLVVAAIITLIVRSHDKSPEERRREFGLFVLGQGGRLATAVEVAAVKRTRNFSFHSESFRIDLYLFCPTLEVNVAVLDRMMEKPGIGDYNTVIIPMPVKDSATSEQAVGMCLLDSTAWSIADLTAVAPAIRNHKNDVGSVWSNLSDNDKSIVSKALTANKAVSDRLNGAKVLVIFDEQGYLFRDWSNLDKVRDHTRGKLFGF